MERQDVRASPRPLDELATWDGAPELERVPPGVRAAIEAHLGELRLAVADLRAQNAGLRAQLRSLEADHRRYRDLYHLAPGAYLVTDGGGLIQQVNRAAALLLGSCPEVVVGTALQAFVASEDRSTFQEQLEALRDERTPRAWSVRLHPLAGPPFPSVLAAAPLDPGAAAAPCIGWILGEPPELRGAGACGAEPPGAVSPEERRQRAAGEQAAVSRERVRVATELHDTLSQMLFSVALKLDWCLHRVPGASELRPKLEEIREESGLMMAHIRALIARLADTGGPGQTFSGRLRTLVEQLRELTGIAVDLVEAGDVARLEAPQQGVLGNVFQEALANIAKHAHASRARIRLDVGADHVHFEVTDDGVGIPPGTDLAALPSAPGHFGLRQMIERVEGLGGRLELGRSSPSGFRLRGALPVR